MRKAVTLALSALFAGLQLVSARADEPALAPLDSLLNDYYTALLPAETDEKCAEMDWIIESCKDSAVRNHVALEVYRHYADSRLMGEESVAIHVYDRWFSDGRLKFEDEAESFAASVFAEFNRQSQLFMDAPRMVLKRPSGMPVRVPRKGRLSVLYFYDTSCPNCKLTNILLPHVLEEAGITLTLYMCYCGTDKAAWKEFRRGFECIGDKVKTVHLWDRNIRSGYQKKYGVTATPRLFVIDPSLTITGRRLDVASLQSVLDYYTIYENNAKEKKQDAAGR